MGKVIKQFVVVILIICFSNAAFADEKFRLLKAGASLTPTEDLHCLSNAGALKLAGRLKLCTGECKIQLDELGKLKDLEIRALSDKLDIQKDMYVKIIGEKDRTIRQIEEVTLTKLSENGTSWWKVALAVAGGMIVGAGVSIGVFYAIK